MNPTDLPPRRLQLCNLSAAAFLASSMAVFLPLQVYLANTGEYTVPWWGAVRTCGLVAGVLFALLALPGLLLPSRWRIGWAALLVGLSAAAYLQANYFVWNYGLLDGRDLQWARNAGRTWLELGIEIPLVLLPLLLRRIAVRFGHILCLALLVAGGAATLSRALSREAPPSSQFYSIDESRIVTFSPQRNVVVVLLDEFQSNILTSLLDKDPALKTQLQGFTYFPNAVAGFAKTYGSIPNLLTGEFYDNHEPIRDYLRRAYAHSVLPDLKRAGERVEIYPWSPRVFHLDPAIATNVVPKFPPGLFPAELLSLFDISLFRHVPHPLKRQVAGDDPWLVSRLAASLSSPDAPHPSASALASPTTPRDLQFLRLLPQATIASDRSPVLKFYHLQGPHEPLWLGGDWTIRRLPKNQEGYLEQARGSLRVAAELVATIDRLGLAACTDIFIISDHGAGEYAIPAPGVASPSQAVGAVERASGLPLVLFRRAGARGPLQTSPAPVALVDVAATLAQLGGVAPRPNGRSLLSPSADPLRPRHYFHYSFEGWDQRYLPALHEYEVRGDSWNPDSWIDTGRILAPRDTVPATPGRAPAAATPTATALTVGREMTTGKGQPGQAFLASGWSSPENRYTWSDGKHARLDIPVTGPASSYVLSLRVRPWLLTGRHDRQQVLVTLNGRPAGRHVLGEATSIRIVVPAAVFASGRLSVQLDLPDAASPLMDYQSSRDSRTLGIALYGLSLSPLPPLPSDHTLTFTGESTNRAYLLTNWSEPGGDGPWCQGQQASLAVAQLGGDDVQLTIDLAPYLHLPDRASQVVAWSVAGQSLAQWTLTGPAIRTLRMPRHLFVDGWATLEMTLLPADSGRGDASSGPPGMNLRRLTVAPLSVSP